MSTTDGISQSVPSQPVEGFGELTVLVKRMVRTTLLVALGIAVILWLALGWQTATLFAVGVAISVVSLYEWGRLLQLIDSQLGPQPGSQQGVSVGTGPKGADAQQSASGLSLGLFLGLFLLRQILFAGAIYGSLKLLHGSPFAMIGGLGLGLAALVWEAKRVLRK